MKNALITTIIPTFRRPQLLKRAIASAMKQTYPHLRICIYDNASGDETEAVVRECMNQDSRIIYHRHNQNIGMMGNYEFALSKVNTPFFSILSDDDVLFPWMYEDAMQVFEKHPQIAFASHTTIFMSPQGLVLGLSGMSGLPWEHTGVLTPSEAALEMTKKSLAPLGILFQKWTLEKGLIDFSNQTVWDWDFILQLTIRYPIYVSEKPGGIFLTHSGSFSSNQNLANWRLSFQKMIARINAFHGLSKSTHDAIIQSLNLNIQYSPRIIASKLADRNWQEASFCLEIYRKDHSLNLTTFILLGFIKLGKHFSPVLYVFTIMRMFFLTKRKFTYRAYAKSLQKNYGKYAEWVTSKF